MKIFICGTENINKKTLYNQLPYDVVSAMALKREIIEKAGMICSSDSKK